MPFLEELVRWFKRWRSSMPVVTVRLQQNFGVAYGALTTTLAQPVEHRSTYTNRSNYRAHEARDGSTS
jgi:hypothetical protein